MKDMKGAFSAFVAHGLMASQEMERFTFAQNELARTTASVFKPALDTATELVFRFNQKLSDSPGMAKIQEMIGRIADFGGKLFDIFGDALLQPIELIGGYLEVWMTYFDLIGDFWRELNDATDGVLEDTIEWAWALKLALDPLNAIIKGYGMLADLLKSHGDLEEFNRLQEERAERKGGGLNKLSPRGGGMEDFKATYQRIQQAILKIEGGDAGRSNEEKIVAAVEATANHTGQINEKTRPAVGD